jgi:hypothetical protein
MTIVNLSANAKQLSGKPVSMGRTLLLAGDGPISSYPVVLIGLETVTYVNKPCVKWLTKRPFFAT